MTKKTNTSTKIAARIDFVIKDNEFHTYLYLFGWRKSNFESAEAFNATKEQLITNISGVVSDAHNYFEQTKMKKDSEYIWV